jgi:prepilin-type N-terminal cleavage/methylation domain-containing protein
VPRVLTPFRLVFEMKQTTRNEKGFSFVELLIATTVLLILLSAVGALLARSVTTRSRETARTEALASAQRAINLMEREIGNSGFGLNSNGLVVGNSNQNQIHFRANLDNHDLATDDLNEDLTYYFDSANQRILRYERSSGTTSAVANGISKMTFEYRNYSTENNGSVTVQAWGNTPSANTAKVRITAEVVLEKITGQPPSTISLVSEVTLRNSVYLIERY